MNDTLDISHHNEITDWAKLRKDSFGVILKATEGLTFRDPKYDERAAMLTKLDMRSGAYHFARPNPESSSSPGVQGRKEAKAFLDATSNNVHPLGRFLDWEQTHQHRNTTTLDKGWANEWITGWHQIIPKGPVYCSLDQALLLEGSYPLWVAKWSDDPPPKKIGNHPVTLWQYTSQGRIGGVSGRVDLSKDMFGYR